MTPQDQSERTIIVTGAASGIGAAIARTLAGPGIGLLLHTRKNESGLEAVAESCRSAGAEVETMLGDLAEQGVPEKMVQLAKGRLGRIDQIVSNAGQAKRGKFGELPTAELTDAFASMPTAFLGLVNSAYADIEASPLGRVVAISSFVAHGFGTAGPLFPATSAAKAALEALVKALAAQLGPSGSTANAVVPGFTRKQGGGHLAVTPESLDIAAKAALTGRLTEPDDIAATVKFLLSPAASQITGQSIHVDGGLLVR